ncbi:MAG TPA: hypothetical protein VG457_17625 [Planctomycetota bacterium]|nr:hypothetical protein [Planctomycetota bacterium]
MDWFLAAAAPLVVGAVLVASGRVPPAILAYHVFCAIWIFRRRNRVRPLLRWETATARWTIGASLLILSLLLGAPLVVDPSAYREVFARTLYPAGSRPALFALFAVYTLAVHVPLEEIFWRGVLSDPRKSTVPVPWSEMRSSSASSTRFPWGSSWGRPGFCSVSPRRRRARSGPLSRSVHAPSGPRS